MLYGFNDLKLAAAIATALGLQPFATHCLSTASATLARVHPSATLCGDDGRTAPVVLIRTRALVAALDQLTLNMVAKPIILFPTAADLTPAVEARLHRYGWPYLVLDNLLFFRPTGIMATAVASDAFDEMAESLIGEMTKAVFAVPEGTRWGEITLTFNGNDN